MWITRRTNRPDAANEGPVRARLARDKNAAVYLINRIAFIAGKPRSHMRRHFFRGTGFSQESDIPDNAHLSAVPASSRLKPVPRHRPRTEITPVGARLARDKSAAVYLINRIAFIAGKPRRECISTVKSIPIQKVAAHCRRAAIAQQTHSTFARPAAS